MNNLTDKQKELLSNPDVKDLILEFANWQIMGMDKEMLGIQLYSFASQFERKSRFVTNGDGEEIFVGDRCYTVQVNTLSFSTWTCTDTTEVLSFLTYFKSKEKAEEYITLNAPRLSVNDVLNIVVDKDFYRDKLISLVKSKQ